MIRIKYLVNQPFEPINFEILG